MLEDINTWSDYRTKVRHFDAMLEHGKAVAAALQTWQPERPEAQYGQQIFFKLIGHAAALRRLVPDAAQFGPRELELLPSLSALARCVVEAHDAFEYIAGHVVSDSERNFRIRLWELHDATRRLKIMDRLAPTEPGVASLRAQAQEMQAGVEGHPFLAGLPEALQSELRRRLSRGEPPAFHLGQRQRCVQSGIDAHWHDAITLDLSQQVHTLPFSVQPSMLHPRPEEPHTPRLMGQPLVSASPFLARAVHAMHQLAPRHAPSPPSRTARTIEQWRSAAQPRAA